MYWTNTLAYLTPLPVTKKESYKTMTLNANYTKSYCVIYAKTADKFYCVVSYGKKVFIELSVGFGFSLD